jgi:diadenosine tetraphosphatase ApaH/serine/threonine PP2A family protein phosphatase
MPTDAPSTADLTELVRSGTSWLNLFPRLHRNEDAVWRALATLEEQNQRVAFHGHTHVQQVWVWRASGTGARRLEVETDLEDLALEEGTPEAPARYLIGVGSAGDPQDGPALRYALYDDDAHKVTLRRVFR